MSGLRNETAGGFWSAWLSLAASGSTLVCCALPALLVALGAGSVLAGLVSALPQLVWLSEHKEALFLVAGALLLLNGAWQWRLRRAPCPLDPAVRRACLRGRRFARRLYGLSLLVYLVGAWFAFFAVAT